MTQEQITRMNTTSLSDETFSRMLEAGFSISEVERWYAQTEYRKEYNSRPEVVAKRKAYTVRRNARMSILSKLLKGGE